MKRLTCYRIRQPAPKIVPAAAERDWMDRTDQRYAYRCLPLTVANSMGWELLAPMDVVAEWNGGDDLSDLVVLPTPDADVASFASSHFGSGILTFQTMHLFRTDPGVALWVRGPPNSYKDGAYPLEGLVEADWLSFTFTMNWKFTRPGRVVFAKESPFCFITTFGYSEPQNTVSEILDLGENRELFEQYKDHRQLRVDFNARLASDDPVAVKEGWQKWYTRGVHPNGDKGASDHVSKVRISKPIDRTKPVLMDQNDKKG